jgi:uroporphyrinogen-III synthase
MVRMLVTRPEPDASETAGKLSALGIEPVVEPLLRYETLQTSLPDPSGFAAMVVTSGNALRALQARDAIAPYRHLKLFAVGDRTAEAARALGFAQVESARSDVHDLVSLLADARLEGPIFYPAARERAGDLGKALAKHGVMVIGAKVYGMSPVTALTATVEAELDAGAIAAALFFSRRTAETFVSLAADLAGKARLGMLCVSEAVAAPLLSAHFVRVGLADHPSEDAMLGLALSFARGEKRGMIDQ